MFSEEKLKEVMGAILDVPPDGIGPGTNTDNIAGWDSLKHMRLIIALEEAFDLTIPDEEVTTMTSYEIVKLVVAEQVARQ
jgi:acyl carrier protein